jgi:CRP-like cAMP-binding protein
MKPGDPDDQSTSSSDDPLAETMDVARARDFSFLSKQRFFRSLDQEILSVMYSSMSERHFQEGEVLIRQGDHGDSLMVVANGEIEVSVLEDGKQHLLKHAGPGEIVGEMALLTDEPRSASVTAYGPVRAYVISAEKFHELATEHPKISALLTLLLASRLGKAKHDALTGNTFHGFKILRCLGRGGTSVVYEAQDSAKQRHVALKMMSHRLLYDPAAMARFQREAELLEAIDHPNIARFYGRFEAFRTSFMIMEFCEGVTIGSAMIHGRLPETIARRILGQVACALAEAHGAGIFHRDIKPSNIMASRDGSVKLIDFGLAGRLDDEPLTRSLLGTPRYMAPEQMTGQPVGKGTDLFALGHVAFEMVSGERLFQSADLWDLTEEVGRWQPPDLLRKLPDVSSEYRDVIRGVLKRDPDSRQMDFDLVRSWAGSVDVDMLDSPRAS